MSSTRLLLLSNSTMSGTPYLEYAQSAITQFLVGVKQVLFIPFAAVTINFDDYLEKVQNGLTNFKIVGIHNTDDYQKAVANAEAICVGGGNTFHLLYHLQVNDLLDAIRKRVINDGVPYVGWSAGSNVAAPDIGTTNDMPVIWPKYDRALNLVPYNINPHYNEWKPMGYQGEGRNERLDECVVVRKKPIVALSEGLAILVQNGKHAILAPDLGSYECTRCAKIWKPKGDSKTDFQVDDLSLSQDFTSFIS